MEKEAERKETNFKSLVSKLDNDLDLSCLGGQVDAKRILLELVEQLKYVSVFQYWDSPPPRGILLVGPPGTGKSHAVRCLANEVKCYLVEIRYEDIASKYVDEPIELLRKIKESVSEVTATGKKVIIYLDEADNFLPSRDGFGMHMADKKKTNFFLTWMDGGLKIDHNLIFIAATNYEEGIDPAAKRSGRLEERIEFKDLDFNGAIEVLKIHVRLSEKRAGRKLFDDISWDELKGDIGIVSGADISKVVKIVKKRQAQKHRTLLMPRLTDRLGKSEFLEHEDALMGIMVEADDDITPGLILTEDVRKCLAEVSAERRKASKGKAVRGFNA